MKREEIIKIGNLFGLELDFDRWDSTTGARYLRFVPKDKDLADIFNSSDSNNVLVIYRGEDRHNILKEFQLSLIRTGKRMMVREARTLLNI